MAQPPSLPNRDGGSRWLLAVGVGCGALMVLVILGIIAGVTAFRYGMDEMRVEMQSEFAREYQRMQEDEKIPEEYADTYQRISDVVMGEDTSFTAVAMGVGVLVSQLDDGEVTEAEAAHAETFATFLEENPNVGVMGIARFVEEHPEFNATFEDAQHMQGTHEPPDADDETPDADDESPAEDVEPQ